MVTTRSAERKAVEEAGKAWHETDGAGEHTGAWGIGGTAGAALAYAGTTALLLLCPGIVIFLCAVPLALAERSSVVIQELCIPHGLPSRRFPHAIHFCLSFAPCSELLVRVPSFPDPGRPDLLIFVRSWRRRWFTITQLDGSLAQLYGYVKEGGLQVVIATWPTATPEAWKTIAAFGALQAALQLFMPGKRFEGPISPKGNVPVYKVLLCCALLSLGTRCFSNMQPSNIQLACPAGKRRPVVCRHAGAAVRRLEVRAALASAADR